MVLFVAIVTVAVAAWCVAAYSMIGVLVNARGGKWFRMLFQFGWWNPNRIHQYVEPPGVPHHKRLLRAMIWFFAALSCAMVYTLWQISKQM